MKAFLTEVTAKGRASSVLSGVSYDLLLNLNKGSEYSGLCSYEFKIANKNHVFLDFTGKQISSLTLNSNKLSASDISSIWQNGMIQLPKSELSSSQNQLVIEFQNQYFNDGNGLHSFIDTDGRQYIYTQSEPYWTNRIFPVFDQPDIKGCLSLQTLFPDDWTVIANSSTVSEGTIDKLLLSDLSCQRNKQLVEITQKMNKEQLRNKRYARFANTPVLPTYLYGLAAGPFARIRADQTNPGVEMSIYCRESLKEFAAKQQKELFEYCIEGTKFYNQFFQVEYPFEKFDYVFCPEYTVGAMEYPGIITFNDRYLFREKPTATQVSHRGETIVHELAHMWFGNLVTMKWWNDLWLNEAFASWVSYLANAHINHKLSFKTIDSWTSFQLQKFRAYNEDQELTTHPIASEVASTDKADAIFDAITYCKGASVLKQLHYLLGHELFSNNIGSYFKKHRWNNTTLSDFLSSMAQGTENVGLPITMQEWNKMWIETAGLNVVTPVWNSNSPQTSNFELELRQSAALKEFPLLRYHKMKVGLFGKQGKLIAVKDVMLLNQETTKVTFEDIKEKVCAVLPNYDDHTFIKINFDATSTQYFLNNTRYLTESSQSSLLVTRAFYEMVRDAMLKVSDFVEFVCTQVFPEKEVSDVLVYETVSSMVHECIFKFAPKDRRIPLCNVMFKDTFAKFSAAKDSETRKSILKKLIGYAYGEQNIKTIADLLLKDIEGEKLFGIGDLWNVAIKVQSVSTFSQEYKSKVLTAVESKDKSDLMKYSKLFISSMQASLSERHKLWAQATDLQSKISYGDLDYMLGGMFSLLVPEELKTPFYPSYFEQLPEIIKHHSKTYARTFLTSCLPDTDNVQPTIDNLRRIVDRIDSQNEYFLILLRKTIFALERKGRVLAFNQ